MSSITIQYPGQRLGGQEPEFRLLTLDPGHSSDPITCTLHNHTLTSSSPLSYEALSYEWGASLSSHSILVNSTPFPVTDNLFHALHHLRRPTIPRTLWIDALCIDQSDLRERNHQVQQMTLIYTHAHTVLAWVGLPTRDSPAAFDFLREAFDFSPRNIAEVKDDPRWGAVGNLCRRSYWGRVWIVQEICLAKRLVVVCGERMVPWKYISELRTARRHVWPQYLARGEREFLKSTPAAIDRQREAHRKGGCVLWVLLEAFQESLCREVHDRVYGFLGLSGDCGGRGIVVDYAKPVVEVYEDVMRFYHGRFKGEAGAGPPRGPQLVRLSEFLHRLLGPGLEAPGRGLGSLTVETSAARVVVIEEFLNAGQAGVYRASEMANFLEGTIPYSHLGRWREFVSPGLSEVHSVTDGRAALYCHFGVGRSVISTGHPLEKRKLFLARPPRRAAGRAGYSRYVIGVAPEGAQLGDLVCTFVQTQVALVFTPTAGVRSIPMDEPGFEVLHGGGFALVGRAVVDLSTDQDRQPFEARVNADKTVETVQTKDPESPWQDTPWLATVSIDTVTLLLATKPGAYGSAKGFAKASLNLLPRDDPKGSREEKEPKGKRTAGQVDDEILGTSDQANTDRLDVELQKLRLDPQLRKHALGPGNAGILNLGATGYLSATLQILYMLKPIREAVLNDATVRTSKSLGAALYDLFVHLQTSSLPVSPLALTKAMGWGERQLQEAQDVSDFFGLFTHEMYRGALGAPLQTTFMDLFAGKTEMRFLYGAGARRVEQFVDIIVDAYSTREVEITSLADALRNFCRPGHADNEIDFQKLPPAWVIHLRNFFYNLDGELETARAPFTYPRLLDLATILPSNTTPHPPSDLVYQLHGVIIREEVLPVPRFLLYLRPRRDEPQWLLFFNEAVTYALESEVFEHNFRAEGGGGVVGTGGLPEGAPLRVPIMCLYLRVGELGGLL
ncbi:heterokaryon incompatibility protein-domain-containing protein [Staphylotrichum tortipilum]|uniref:Heterokaryon incompatibility protein-domain-containing protein n=1 Tax=Staphylotrichum tortipilum TaxID=2831512 RepID=A0AAN6RT85_9PEZI|nr:heterokaryon incompatibility protein-domain-containing protein [Staphylotrichum longicolle]